MKFYVASTNQIPALGYVPQADCPIRVYISYQSDYHLRVCISHNHITAFGYLVQIIAFLATDVIELGGCAQRMTLTKDIGPI